MYLLSLDGPGQQAEADSTEEGQPLGDLPLQLIFRELSRDSAERTLQTWISEGGGPWTWELVVELRDGTVQATLTATPTVAVAETGRLVWKNRNGWDAFGVNRIDPEPSDPGTPILRVAAP